MRKAICIVGAALLPIAGLAAVSVVWAAIGYHTNMLMFGTPPAEPEEYAAAGLMGIMLGAMVIVIPWLYYELCVHLYRRCSKWCESFWCGCVRTWSAYGRRSRSDVWGDPRRLSMPTKAKPTEAQMVEVLATRGMNWIKPAGCGNWYENTGRKGSRQFVADGDWNPFTCRDDIAGIEDRLTDEQWHAYWLLVVTDADARQFRNFKIGRTAAPAVCAEALCRVIAPELFEGASPGQKGGENLNGNY